MLLQEIEIKNYRSLEHVKLDALGRFNVLIGRNNAGKSSVFGALALLHSLLQGVQTDFEPILTGRNTSLPFEIRLMFKLREDERAELINLTGSSPSANSVMVNSPLFRQIEYSFGTDPGGSHLALRQLRVRALDNAWSSIFLIPDIRTGPNPEGRMMRITHLARNFDGGLGQAVLDVTNKQFTANRPFNRIDITSSQIPDPATSWIFTRVGDYLRKSFFFHPFRHSQPRLAAHRTERLAQDGSDLAQVLLTILSNDHDVFFKIERFIHGALPDVGSLQTPLQDNTTETAFRSPAGNYPVRLHDMGGGIEQLLMVATVLLTTGEESSLFLEEPESHLHAGAQRFLMERLFEGDRQVFITTHSPTFVNSPRRMTIHQVRYIGNKTTITKVDNTVLLGETLEDIGSRNSDVLLSDAVLFVEGPGDKRVFEELGEKTGQSLREHNITVISMGGSEEAARGARARSDVLVGISQRSPVPHLFVLDRDERGKAEISSLTGQLTDKVHLLERRELENYMLVPRALLEAIRDKHRDDAVVLERTKDVSADTVMSIIHAQAEALFPLVLVKRIRAEVRGLRGGLLPRETVAGLAQKVHYKNFSRLVRREIEARVSGHLDALEVEKIVAAEKKALQREWKKTENRLVLAPGEELVAAVFRHFGSEYRKPSDTVRIAKVMTAEEIPEEIRDLIRRIVSMSNVTES